MKETDAGPGRGVDLLGEASAGANALCQDPRWRDGWEMTENVCNIARHAGPPQEDLDCRLGMKATDTGPGRGVGLQGEASAGPDALGLHGKAALAKTRFVRTEQRMCASWPDCLDLSRMAWTAAGCDGN